MHKETLRLREAKLGPDHPDTLISRNNLAMLYLDDGRTDEAIAMLAETLRLRAASWAPTTSRRSIAGIISASPTTKPDGRPTRS